MPQLPGQPKLHGYYNYQNDTKGELKWTHIDKTIFCGQRKNHYKTPVDKKRDYFVISFCK